MLNKEEIEAISNIINDYKILYQKIIDYNNSIKILENSINDTILKIDNTKEQEYKLYNELANKYNLNIDDIQQIIASILLQKNQ